MRHVIRLVYQQLNPLAARQNLFNVLHHDLLDTSDFFLRLLDGVRWRILAEGRHEIFDLPVELGSHAMDWGGDDIFIAIICIELFEGRRIRPRYIGRDTQVYKCNVSLA